MNPNINLMTLSFFCSYVYDSFILAMGGHYWTIVHSTCIYCDIRRTFIGTWESFTSRPFFLQYPLESLVYVFVFLGLLFIPLFTSFLRWEINYNIYKIYILEWILYIAIIIPTHIQIKKKVLYRTIDYVSISSYLNIGSIICNALITIPPWPSKNFFTNRHNLW